MPWDFWLIFVFLAVVLPWRGRIRLRQLLAVENMATKERIRLYAMTIAFQWLLTGIVLWRALAHGLTGDEMGLAGKPFGLLVALGIGGAAILGVLHWFNLRRIAKLEGPAPEFMRRIAERIMPRTAMEFPPFMALAVTAGICEEFLYRGFAMAALARVGVSAWGVVLITAILFGLAHTYQGRTGVAGTTVLGLALGGVRITVDSLVPIVIWHSMIDVVAGIAGSRYLLPVMNRPQDTQNQSITG